MRIRFSRPASSMPTVLAEAEILSDEFPGLKWVGFQVRRGDRGPFVTFPSRAYGAGRDRHYYEYLRPIAEDHSDEAVRVSNGFRGEILSEFARWAKVPLPEPVEAVGGSPSGGRPSEP